MAAHLGFAPPTLPPPLRHAAASRCNHPIRRLRHRPPLAALPTAPQPADLAPRTPASISPKGFALRDATTYPFTARATFSFPGAYAIRNETGQLCYIGYTKNLSAKLAFHEHLVPDECHAFQLYVPPTQLVSPEMLENVLEYWVRENGGVPRGNATDRQIWEKNDQKEQKDRKDRKPSPTSPSAIPVRERSTPARIARPVPETPDPFSDTFRSSSASRRQSQTAWTASQDDYVELEVDPLDPFSASKRRASTNDRWDDEDFQTDWLPIVALVSMSALLWFIGFVSNALPAASPSLGM